jgi:hypothetical protein
MCFVGLWNETAAEVEETLDGGWEFREGTYGEMADCVWGGMAVDHDVTGFGELGGGWLLLGRGECAGAKKCAE